MALIGLFMRIRHSLTKSIFRGTASLEAPFELKHSDDVFPPTCHSAFSKAKPIVKDCFAEYHQCPGIAVQTQTFRRRLPSSRSPWPGAELKACVSQVRLFSGGIAGNGKSGGIARTQTFRRRVSVPRSPRLLEG